MWNSKRLPVIVGFVLAPLLGANAQGNNPLSSNPNVLGTVPKAQRVDPQQPDVQTVKPRVNADAPEKRADLTQIYKIGVGDTLHIVLTNAPSASGDYAVRTDGTIDFPLAGDRTKVEGMVTSEIEQMLGSRVKLYQDARLRVKVHGFGSHRVYVSGLVERGGERFLQREAVPLFTIKADVGMHAAATKVVVRRSSGMTETYKLDDVHTDDVLIYSGDVLEFVGRVHFQFVE